MAIRQLAGAAVVGGVAIFGGVTAMGDETVRDETGAIEEAGGVGVFAIQFGDCLVVPEAVELQSLEGVPCDQPHDSQAYDAFDLTGFATLPNAVEMEEAAFNGCVEGFESFVGVPYEESTLYISWLEPTAGSWAEGDREIQCMVVPEDGLINFDARNSGV